MRTTPSTTTAVRTTAILILTGAALAAGLVGASDDAPEGAARLAPFKQQLMGTLMSGLARGPVEAVDTCQVEAPQIAGDLSGGGVQVGRTSHRLRNPDNAGPPWATEVLQAYLEQSGDWAPRDVALPDGRQGYVEPIVTQPLCLICHGSDLSPQVAEAIAERYPEDRATGFETGDLRGVFWISWTPEEAAGP